MLLQDASDEDNKKKRAAEKADSDFYRLPHGRHTEVTYVVSKAYSRKDVLRQGVSHAWYVLIALN